MASLLVHVTHGPEAPTRAALAFLVARAAIDEGHDVTMFLAGDSVQLLRDAVLDSLTGLGTGSLRESFDAVVAGGAALYASGMSSKARGVGEVDIDGKPVELAPPAKLVQLTFENDRVLTY
jgi:predicted peroxiredoxin